MAKTYMYVSLWDHNPRKAKGLMIYEMDQETGAIKHLKTIYEDRSINQIYIDEKKGVMYLSNETEKVPETPFASGTILGCKIKEDGDLEEFFRKATYSPNPCYMNLDESGKFMVSAHHSSYDQLCTLRKQEDGTWKPVPLVCDSAVMLFAVNEDGSLGDHLDVKNHNPEYAELHHMKNGRVHVNHPHGAMRAPLYHNIFAVPDKGDGNLYMYTIDEEKKELVLTDKQQSDTVPTSKARYCRYHPTKPFLFVNHENMTDGDMHMTTFKYDENGKLEKVGVYKGMLKEYDCSDPKRLYSQQGMVISPDGKYIYSICRNPNIILVYEVNQETGELTAIQNIEILGGDTGRGIAITPNGKFVVTTCLFSESLDVFAVGEDGKLSHTDIHDNVLGASYINFYTI